MVAPATITRIMQLVLVVSNRAEMNPSQVRFRLIMATIRVENAPTAPASVGVKIPPKSPPITRIKIMRVSITPDSDAIFSFHEVLGPRGPSSGLRLVHMRMLTTMRAVRRMPGRIPAMKSSPMDCSVRMPYTIKITLGGIRIPRLPPAATTPVASSGL